MSEVVRNEKETLAIEEGKECAMFIASQTVELGGHAGNTSVAGMAICLKSLPRDQSRLSRYRKGPLRPHHPTSLKSRQCLVAPPKSQPKILTLMHAHGPDDPT
jgi:hypothetical protein